MKKIGIVFTALLSLALLTTEAWGATYYSQGILAPDLTTSWNSVRTGGGSAPANFTTGGDAFVIQNTHSMTTSTTWSISGAGSTLQIENGGTLTASDSVVLVATTTFQIDNGGTYVQNAALSMDSTIFKGTEVFGASSNVIFQVNPALVEAPASPGYGNLTFNITGAGTAGYGWSSTITSIQGNFTIQSTGSAGTAVLTSGALTLTIGGNLSISDGTLVLNAGASDAILNVSGNFSQTGGILQMSTSSGIGTINLSGNFSMTTAGSITETSTGSGAFVFNKSGTQTFTKTAGTIANTINFTVNSGSTLDMGTNVLDGSGGTFTLSSGATLGIGSTAGITSSGATGNIQVTGTRTFSTGANYTYNGSASQATGNGLPSTVNNLTINNSSGVNSSANETVNGTLTLTSGNVITGANTLSISSTGSVTRTSGHVVGNLKKNVATGATSRTFEIGDASNYTPINVSFGNVTSAGDLTANATASDHPNIANSVIIAAKSVNRNWTTTNSGVSFDTYSATFNFVAGDIDSGASTNNFYVGKLDGGTWTLPAIATRSATSIQATGMTSFSDFQVGESSRVGSLFSVFE